MEGSKEMFVEQRIWEDNQDPKLLGELIKQYLTERTYANQNTKSSNQRLQGNKGLGAGYKR